ncbi:sulfate ABC transporter, permease protein CysT [Chitinispirillum alkaliphilum]|nr:sulfate ABC transporter, permease protein CysT [Chitinispirillum alkaliphilum]
MTEKSRKNPRSVIPGFGLTMGFTLVFLSLVVLIPLSTILLKTSSLSWGQFVAIITDERVIAAYTLTLTVAFSAAIVNVVFGVVISWVLIRYDFPGRKILDGLIDLPFALPTAVAGISLTAIYAPNGLIGGLLNPLGISVAYAPLGIVIALVFIGLPFVVRTVQPVIQEFDKEVEEASVCLGACRWTTFRKVIFPQLLPAILTGFALALARGIGEYGSVIFISGNMPYATEVVSLLIMSRLEQFDYTGATAIALVMLMTSFVILLTVNLIQWYAARFTHERK